MQNLTIRLATPDDAGVLAPIYAHYVDTTAYSFETTAPTVAEFATRIENTLSTYPFLVAEVDGAVAGYAYGAALRSRPAYDWALETTVYLSPDYVGHGVGRLLYLELFGLLEAQNFTMAYACITGSNTESIAFHQKQGFETVGRFTNCGYKHDAWHDVVWMERTIADAQNPPIPVVPMADMVTRMM